MTTPLWTGRGQRSVLLRKPVPQVHHKTSHSPDSEVFHAHPTGVLTGCSGRWSRVSICFIIGCACAASVVHILTAHTTKTTEYIYILVFFVLCGRFIGYGSVQPILKGCLQPFRNLSCFVPCLPRYSSLARDRQSADQRRY